MNTRLRQAFMTAVITAGLSAFAWSAAGLGGALGHRAGPWAVLLVVAVLVGLFPVPIPGTRSVISVTDTFIFSSVLFFGVYPSVVLAGVDALVSTLRRTRKLSSNLFSCAVMSASVFIAGSLFEWLVERSGPGAPLSLEALVLPVGCMALAHFIVDSGLVATITALSRRQGVWRTWVDDFLWSSVSFFAGASAAAVGYVFIRSGWFTLLALLPILLITYYTYKIYMEKVEEKNHHISEMASVHLATIEALTMAIEAKDQVTYGHVRRSQAYALALGRVAGLDEQELEGLKVAALLHDIGKLAIPEHILNKPGRLTTAEFERMKRHPVIGAEMLANIRFPHPVIPIVRHHHEWWDGSGYPDGLAGDAIPRAARVLALADCYDTMRSPRPWAEVLSRADAVTAIRSGVGSHFDPELVEIFLQNLAVIDRAVPSPGAIDDGGSIAIERTDEPEAPLALASILSAQQETRVLNELARVAGSSLSLEATLEQVLDTLTGFVARTTAVVYLVEDSGETARIDAARGAHSQELVGRTVAVGGGASGWAIGNRRSIANFDATAELAGGELGPSRGGGRRKFGAATPLVVGERALGAIAVYGESEDPLSEVDLRILEIVGEKSSVAILNALTHRATQTTAMTDALTGIPNSRYLEQAFGDRIERDPRPLFLLLIDLDGFKTVNDCLGHQMGDRILKETAQVLRSTLRSEDVLARVGGDEFVILANDDPTAGLVHRLRGSLEEHDFGVGDGDAIRIGLSAGCASTAIDGTELGTLLAVADQRMYRDKAKRKRSRLEQLEANLDPAEQVG